LRTVAWISSLFLDARFIGRVPKTFLDHRHDFQILLIRQPEFFENRYFLRSDRACALTNLQKRF